MLKVIEVKVKLRKQFAKVQNAGILNIVLVKQSH